jgi:hypothetical protein
MEEAQEAPLRACIGEDWSLPASALLSTVLRAFRPAVRVLLRFARLAVSQAILHFPLGLGPN